MYRDEKVRQLQDVKNQLAYVETALTQPLEIWERAEYLQAAADYRTEIAKREKHIALMDDMYPGGIVGSW